MFVVSFALWVGMSRLLMSWLLLLSGHPIGPAFPLLLYYNQIVGSIVKIHVSFRLDQQSWTRQRTKLAARGDAFQTRFHWWSSQRSAERRVGHVCVSPCSSRCAPCS